MMQRFVKNRRRLVLAALMTPILALLVYLDTKNANIGFIQLHSIDEFAFHGSIRHMYQGLTGLNLSSLFSFGFYQYGFAYFALNLIAALPGLLAESSSLAIIGPRLVTSAFAVGSLIIVYIILNQGRDRLKSLFAVLFIATMPAFWFNATWFHPDWLMTFFLLFTIYLLDRDNWSFDKYFWLAILSYGIAIALKYQAITFIPLIGLYIFYDNIQSLNSNHLWPRIVRFGKCLSAIAVIFIVLNPYILHPMGWKVFSGAFMTNMRSNATNHGSANIPTLKDKVENAIGSYYLHPALLIALILTSVWIASTLFRKRDEKDNRNLYAALALTFLINLCYLLFFVNKAWQIYYLPVVIIGVLPMFSLTLRDLAAKRYIFGGIVALHIALNAAYYVPLLTESRDAHNPDFNSFSASENLDINAFIINSLEGRTSSESVVLITPYTPFEYEKLGLSYEQIKTIYGPLAEDAINRDAYIASQKLYWGSTKSIQELAASFKPIDIIVLRKDIPFIDVSKIKDVYEKDRYEAAAKIMKRLFDGSLGYIAIAENEHVVIFSVVK